ncbi:MAG TPA: hypothetical protein VE086_03230 [Chthoniobacterales bacterium]|nr:hypothetical protein [Chthoniobacterales bacterium]
MKNLVRPGVFLLGMVLAAAAHAGTPAIKVCVSDEAGKVAFKGVVNAGTTFGTGNLRAGDYVVQFNSSSGAIRDNQYFVIVSAGQRKVIADSVSGKKFDGGGVAMSVRVAAGLKITGQIARISTSASNQDAVVRVIEGETVRKWQDNAGEGSSRDHYAGRTSRMIGQTGRGY